MGLAKPARSLGLDHSLDPLLLNPDLSLPSTGVDPKGTRSTLGTKLSLSSVAGQSNLWNVI